MGTNMGCFCGRAKKGEPSCSSNDGGVCDTIPAPGCINDNGRAPEWIVTVRGFDGYLFHQCHWLQSPGKFKPSLLYFYSLYILQLFFIRFILYIESCISFWYASREPVFFCYVKPRDLTFLDGKEIWLPLI